MEIMTLHEIKELLGYVTCNSSRGPVDPELVKMSQNLMIKITQKINCVCRTLQNSPKTRD